jgi:xanthine dehydrogenase iron-sulfur cluster and FAD-binding subunit A
MEIRFILNGQPVSVDATPASRAIALIREDLGITGTKEGCGSGECGACTILVDGENRLACLMLAAQLEGRQVTTVEGLAEGGTLRPLQEAFVRRGAVQCGFCSPGMILAAEALLARNPAPSREEIREGLSGNLCRCTGYGKIVDAVETASGPTRERGPLQPSAGEDGRNDHAAASPTASGIGPSCPTPVAVPTGRVFFPRNLPELWDRLEEEPEALLFAGGTDLFVRLRKEREAPPTLVGLERIADLQGVRQENDRLWIGAGMSHSRLIGNPMIGRHLPILIRALESLGSPPIRNMGTLGGNICTASPAGDTLPPLYALDAEVELRSAKGRRVMPIAAFITGPGKTGLEKGEILAAVGVRIPVAYGTHHFEKIGQRKALACSVASPRGPSTNLHRRGDRSGPPRLGERRPTIVTAPEVEAALVGQRLTRPFCRRPPGSPAGRFAHRRPAGHGRLPAEVSGNLLLRLAAQPLKGHRDGESPKRRQKKGSAAAADPSGNTG